MLNAKKVAGTGGARAKPLDADNYPARLVQVIDLGVQNQRPYQGQEKPPVHEIMLTYELVTEFMLDDEGKPDEARPRWISERMPLYNLSADKAKSTKRYTALDPKMEAEGDWSQMIGKSCLVAVVNREKDGRVYNNVGAVSPPVKGMAIAELVNEGKVFDQDTATSEEFFNLPDWIQGIIREGLDFPGSKLHRLLEGGEVEPEPEVGEASDDLPY